jgi:hypothetical protein
MCVGGGLCITALLIGSIAMIIVLTGISAALSIWIFKVLGKYLKK